MPEEHYGAPDAIRDVSVGGSKTDPNVGFYISWRSSQFRILMIPVVLPVPGAQGNRVKECVTTG